MSVELPRFIRMRDAPSYLGMDRHRFNEEVRPTLTEIPIGSQGLAFDRLELDAWADYYIGACGRPPEVKEALCLEEQHQDSVCAEVSGIFRK